jgi:hypothetical protein
MNISAAENRRQAQMGRRHNGEGSIYPAGNGYRGYVWCTGPDGERYRKYVSGKTFEEAQQAWFKLRDQSRRGPVSSDVPKLVDFLGYWLTEIVQPNLAPKHAKNTSCSRGCTLFLISVPYDWIESRLKTSGSGLTN